VGFCPRSARFVFPSDPVMGDEYIYTITHGVRQKGMISAAYFTNFLATGIRF
jgi:hypothetical protein